MATTTQPATETTGRAYDQFVKRGLDRAGMQVKLVDLATSILLIVTVVLGVLLAVCVIDGWIAPLGPWVRLAILMGLAGFAVLVLVRSIGPLLLWKINPAYAARVIEQSEPSLKNSLLNYVFLKSRPNAQSQRVFEAVQAKAAQDLSSIAIESAIDRSRLIQIGFALVGIALACGVYKLVSPKDPLATVARVVAPLADIPSPSRVRIQRVEPGSIDIFFGETIDVRATIRGAGDSPVALVYSTDDGQRVNATIPLAAQDNGSDFSGVLTTSDAGIQQNLSYWIVAGDGRSSTYQVNVRPSPTISVSKIDLTPPAYTELPPITLTGQADIEGIEGTSVHLEAIANQDIASASLELLKTPAAKNTAGELNGGSRPAPNGNTPVELQLVERLPMGVSDRGSTVEFKLLRSGAEPKFTHYRLKFTSTDGQRNRFEPIYAVRIKPDLAPEIEVLEPSQAKLQLPINGKLTIKARALDPDFRIAAIRMIGVQKGREIIQQNLVLDQPSGVGNVHGRFDFRPEAFNLQPGDDVVFHLAAIDNRMSPLSGQPDPNVTRSANYELKIMPPSESAKRGSEKGDSESGSENRNSNGDSEKSQQPNSGDQNADSQDSTGEAQPSEEQNADENAGGSNSGNPAQKNAADTSEKAQGGNSKSNDQNPSQPSGESDGGDTSDPSDSENNNEQGNNPPAAGQPKKSGERNKPQPKNANPGDQGNAAENSDPSQNSDPSKPSDGSDTSESSKSSGTSESTDTSESSDRSNAANDPQRNPSESSNRQSSPGKNARPNPDPPSQSGRPNQTPRPLDEAAHDGDRFERLLDHLNREKNKLDAQGNQAQSDQQQPFQEGSGNQQSGNTQQSDRPKSDADSQAENAAESQTGDPSNQSQESADGSNKAKSDAGEPSDQGDKTKSGDQPSENPSDSSQASDKSDPSNSSDNSSKSPGEDSGEGEKSDANNPGANSGEQSGDNSSESENQSKTGGDNAQTNPSEGNRNDSAEGKSDGDKANGSARPRSDASQLPDAASEDANGLDPTFDAPEERELLDRSKTVTDLVVDYLKDQLHKPDPALLDEMNWTEQQLRDFVARWDDMKQAAAQGDETAQQRYAEALRSLGLRNPAEQARRAKMRQDQLRGLNEDGSVSRPPEKYAEAFRDFSKGRAKRDGN